MREAEKIGDRWDEGMGLHRWVCGEKHSRKLRSGRQEVGVESLPKTGRPLDPEPGLGGIFSLGLLWGKASDILNKV